MTEPTIGYNVSIGNGTVIECKGRIGDNVQIGNNVTLEGKLDIGNNTRIDHGSVIRGDVQIGSDNWIYPYCMIGGGPQHKNHLEKDIEDSVSRFCGISIGTGNIIREFSSVHLPTLENKTLIGSHCYMMTYTNVAHDCIIHDAVVMTNNTNLGGHVEIFDGVNLGYGNNVHQFCKIGIGSMLGMGNAITKDVLPFSLINRNTFVNINRIGMQRAGIKTKEIDNIESLYANGAWQQLNSDPIFSLPKNDISMEYGNNSTQRTNPWYEKEIIKFVSVSTRDMYKPKFV